MFFIVRNIFATLYSCTQIFLSLEGEFTTRNFPSTYHERYVSTSPAVQMFITVHCMVAANIINAK
jgi:hypothetical protein